jgi:hypothetical protein
MPNDRSLNHSRLSYRGLLLVPNFPLLHLLQRPRPICFEQPRQTSVCQQLSARLALGAVIGLVLRVDDALDWRPAHRTRFAVFADL